MESTASAVFFVGMDIVKSYIYNRIVNNISIKYKNKAELISEGNMNDYILNSLI